MFIVTRKSAGSKVCGDKRRNQAIFTARRQGRSNERQGGTQPVAQRPLRDEAASGVGPRPSVPYRSTLRKGLPPSGPHAQDESYNPIAVRLETKESAEVSRFFHENGYYVAKGLFGRDDVASLESEFDRIVSQIVATGENVNARWSGPEMEKLAATETTVIHTHNVQQFSGAWLRALLNEKFLDVIEAILGPDIILHHTKLFLKPPEKGSPFPMHQDWGYFPTVKDTMIAGIIHLSEATDEMGCLRVYPGTHKLGRLEGSMGSTDLLMERYPIEGATVLEAEPGDVVFFHYFLIHGSMPNRSTRPRKTVLVQVHAGDDEAVHNPHHPYERLVLRGWNYRMTREIANIVK